MCSTCRPSASPPSPPTRHRRATRTSRPAAEQPGPHADLNHALIVAEVAAATALESSFDTTLTLTALIADRMDATAALETEVEWGSEPVDLSAYERLLALGVDDRVEELLREGAGSDEDPAV